LRHAGTDNLVFFIEFKLYYAITEIHIMSEKPDSKRRDFLQLSTLSIGAVGTAAFIWPFLKSMSPAEDTLALGTTEVDVSSIEEGQSVTVKWRGKPVFIRKRTKDEIDEAKTVNLEDLKDPEEDINRVKKDEWLVLVGVCTHLGCVPLGQKLTDSKGEYNGWYCPCHGSHYDTSGRIRKGPAPENLAVPPYYFLNDTTIKIG
jgi:ubiquinol-cytochrome c reductase iron-sulfur subunit